MVSHVISGHYLSQGYKTHIENGRILLVVVQNCRVIDVPG